MLFDKNSLSQVRPSSTFESFKPFNDQQRNVLDTIKAIADQLIKKSEKIIGEEFPFDNAQMLILSGKAGRGKTHLIEALVNHIKEKSPDLLGKIFLARDDFTRMNSVSCDYNHLPIIIIDDMFSGCKSVDELHPRTDIDSLMKFVKRIYEERRLVIVTCNFSFKDSILPMVKKVDDVGRIVSRFTELLARTSEIEVSGG